MTKAFRAALAAADKKDEQKRQREEAKQSAVGVAEPPKRGRGQPRKSIAEKALAGTLNPTRERQYQEKDRAKALAAANGGTPPPVQALQIEPDPEPKQDYLAVMLKYMADVESGAIVAGKWAKLAVKRQRADMLRGDWEFAFSPFFAVKACAFIEQMPHVEGRWASAEIHLEPWQVFCICVLFGWRYRVDSIRRRFTVFYLELGRKNAKSTLAAVIALYHLLREEEPGAQVVCGATTGSQARIVFNIAKKMVERSAWLRRQGAIARAHSIVCLDGWMKPINAKASTQDGLNPSVILLDEAHAQNFQLHDVLKSAQGARDNPLMLCPTTAGYNLLSVGYAMHQTVQKILEGVLHAEHYFGIIYAIDDGDDWHDEKNWGKANPMLGVTPKIDQFRRTYTDARNTPGMERDFLVKSLSMWFGSAAAWLSIPKWDLCADPSCKLERFLGKECCIGGDLSQSDDMTAIAYTFKIDGIYWTCVQLYIPEDVVMERALKVPELLYWVEHGSVKTTPGSMIDYNIIELDIRSNLKRFQIKDIAFDQHGSLQIVGSLSNDGHPARIEYKNAANATPPARELEARLKGTKDAAHAKFKHDGNPALRWHASNVVVTRKVDGSIIPKKDSAESPNKIDGIEAILRSLSGWLRLDQKKPGGGGFQAMIFGA